VRVGARQRQHAGLVRVGARQRQHAGLVRPRRRGWAAGRLVRPRRQGWRAGRLVRPRRRGWRAGRLVRHGPPVASARRDRLAAPARSVPARSVPALAVLIRAVCRVPLRGVNRRAAYAGCFRTEMAESRSPECGMAGSWCRRPLAALGGACPRRPVAPRPRLPVAPRPRRPVAAARGARWRPPAAAGGARRRRPDGCRRQRCSGCAGAYQGERVTILGRTATTSSSPADQTASASRYCAVEADNSGTWEGGLGLLRNLTP
jgi:hypothetical protein